MAEFQEVIKQANRLCEIGMLGSKCDECPLHVLGNGCGMVIGSAMAAKDIESIVMEWAKNNPEPRNPTWAEWQSRDFPTAHSYFKLCHFGFCGCHLECEKHTDCMHWTIPEDIARKLHIKKIGGKLDE